MRERKRHCVCLGGASGLLTTTASCETDGVRAVFASFLELFVETKLTKFDFEPLRNDEIGFRASTCLPLRRLRGTRVQTTNSTD